MDKKEIDDSIIVSVDIKLYFASSPEAKEKTQELRDKGEDVPDDRWYATKTIQLSGGHKQINTAYGDSSTVDYANMLMFLFIDLGNLTHVKDKDYTDRIKDRLKKQLKLSFK